MANLPSSGPLSILDIKNMFGGPTSPKLTDYYRGGTYMPATKVVSTLVREPAAGAFYEAGVTYWYKHSLGNYAPAIYWGGVLIWSDFQGDPTQWTVGPYTYFRANLMYDDGEYNQYYSIYRISGGSTTVNINTGIPSSGSLSLSHFYNAEKP